MNTKIMRHMLLLAAVAALLTGCVTSYKAEIQQGNAVTQEMINKLKPGMTRSQVRFVLGTPLITDPFHPDRWDYYYSLRRINEETTEARRLTVIFNNDVLMSVQDDTRNKPDDATAGKTGASSSPQPASATDASGNADTKRWQSL